MAITGCDRIPRALRRGPAALPADQDPPARSRSASTHAARWPGVISTTGGLAAPSGKARGHRSTKTQPERGDEGCPETGALSTGRLGRWSCQSAGWRTPRSECKHGWRLSSARGPGKDASADHRDTQADQTDQREDYGDGFENHESARRVAGYPAVTDQVRLDERLIAALGDVQMPSSACRAARWPASTAPSIYPLQALAVSVAAHLIGPIGSLSAAPK